MGTTEAALEIKRSMERSMERSMGSETLIFLTGSEEIFHDNDVDNLVKQFPGSKKIK